jgi:PrtD family type I secretion system ABC transporter
VRELIRRFQPCFVWAALFSVAVNLLLLVPALYMLQLFDRVVTSRSVETLLLLTLAALLALVMMSALDALRARLLAAAATALDRRLGPRVLDGLVAQTARVTGADYVNGLRDTNTLRAFLLGPGILGLFDAPWLPFFLLVVFLMHPFLGVVGLLGAAAMLLVAVFNERFTRQPLERVQAESRRVSRFVDAGLRNAEVIAALGMLPAFVRRWGAQNERMLREQSAASGLGSAFSALTKLARQLVQVAMLAAGAWLVVEQQVTAGIMMASSILLGRALAPVEMLVGNWRTLVEVRSAWRRLGQLLAANPQAGAATELPAPKGALSVERVVFTLRPGDKPILRGVSFALEPGESLGLIGPSGAGKSTLARLVVGVWQAQAGVVRLDGANVATWPRERLGPQIGYLPQDVELFAGTVAENIARLSEVDSAAVMRAAQRAGVHDLVLRLPKGYDTDVGEAGAALSPGQRQRIGLARALYGEPRLVVLDEPNANLDAEGDEALVRALRDLKQAGATTIVIAHRPSLLGGVDRLLVLREGAVELFGPRAEIMARVARSATQQIGAA